MRRALIALVVAVLTAASAGCATDEPGSGASGTDSTPPAVAQRPDDASPAPSPTPVVTTWLEAPDDWPTLPPPPPGAPTSGPVDATGLRPSDAELEELRAAATQYFDLMLQSPEYAAMAAGDCLPQSWFGDLAAGRLSYDEFTLLSLRAFSETDPLPRSESVCEGFDGNIQAWAYLSELFWDALDTSTQAEVAQFWNGGIENTTWQVGDADDYRARIAALGTD
jgi:hypothetical protein